MIAIDKPNPFHILEISTDASTEEIVERGQELCELAESEEQRMLFRWAIEQIITKFSTRLEYEIFEIPNTKYEDAEWERFIRKHKKNPINLDELATVNPSPCLEDYNSANLVQLILDGMLKVQQPDIKSVIEESPFKPDIGSPPLEVKDVIFG